MPFNIELSSQPIFLSAYLQPLYTQWELPAFFSLNSIYVQGNYNYPDDLVLPIKIKNYFLEDTENIYSDFKVYTEIHYNPATGSDTGYVNLSGPLTPAQPYGLENNPLDVTLTVGWQDLELINVNDQSNIKNIDIIFKVYGVRNDSGFEEQVDQNISHSIFIQLIIIGSHDLYIKMEEGNTFGYVPGQTQPSSRPVKIYGFEPVILFVPKTYTPVGTNFPSANPLFSNNGLNGYVFDFLAGSYSFSLKPNQTIENTDQDFENGYKFISDNLSLRRYDPSYVHFEKSIRTYLFKDTGINFNKVGLEFFAIKGIEEAEPTDLKIFGNGSFDVYLPSWMIPHTAQGTNYYYLFGIRPIASANFDPGTYHGILEVEGSGGTTNKIPIKHVVVDVVSPGFSENDVNFTLENSIPTQIYSVDDNRTFAAMSLKTTQWAYSDLIPVVSEFNYKLGFFKHKAEIFIGEAVERTIRKISIEDIGDFVFTTPQLSPSVISFYRKTYYRVIKTDFEYRIENKNTSEIEKSGNYLNLRWICGRKPKNFDQTGILNYEQVPRRITPYSKIIFNYYPDGKEHHIIFKKNADQIYEKDYGSDDKKVCGIFYRPLDLSPGDIVQIELNSDDRTFSQKYLVFPRGETSTLLYYESEYGCLESYEFTGKVQYKSEYEFKTAKTFKKLVEAVRNLESTKTQTIVLNTGWMPKSNNVIVDEIIRAGSAYVELNNSLIELRPVSKKMTNSDSQAETYSYDVEFEIIPSNDLQVYS